jgi:octaprenyl-diphosphate synthase
LAVANEEYQLLKIVSEAVKEMAEGELLQMEKARHLNTSEKTYFEIIRKKTATLLASCSAAGAKSAGGTDEQVEMMRQFGEYIGIAFQIKDDLFDFQEINSTGKPSGNDIQEKKMTLPLIYAFSQSSASESRKIKKAINRNPATTESISEIVEYVKANGGLEYATEKMKYYKDRSLEILNKFDDNEARRSLTDLVNYTIDRNK